MSNGGITEYNSINQLNFTETQQTGFNKPLPIIKNPSVDTPLIRMENVTIQYNNNIILNNINWQVNPGECWQIKGHNGAENPLYLVLSMVIIHKPTLSRSICLEKKRKWRKHLGY
jgi:molybdate transport system ATP-binding protein